MAPRDLFGLVVRSRFSIARCAPEAAWAGRVKILQGDWQAGTLVRRYKRFLADVRLKASNELVTAHCPNTGAMTGCLESGADVWLSHSDDPSRKTSFTLELTRIDGHYIGLNTHNANRLIEEAIIKGRLGPGCMICTLIERSQLREGVSIFD